MTVTGRSRRLPVEVGDLHAGRPHVRDVAVLEEDDPVGVGEDRGDVARDEALLAVEPHDQRHVLAGADEPADLALVHHDERVGALDPAERRADGVGEVALVGLLDEVRDRLGVRLGREDVAPLLELVAQLPEVLDDPVVDHRDVAGAVLVGVGVEVVGPAVGRPARVREAQRGVRASGRRWPSGGWRACPPSSPRTGRPARRRGRSRRSRSPRYSSRRRPSMRIGPASRGPV